MRHFIVKNVLISVFSLDLNEFDINEVFLEPIIRLNRGIGVLTPEYDSRIFRENYAKSTPEYYL